MATPIFMAGLPGKMAAETAALVAASDDFELFDIGLSSPVHEGKTIAIGDRKIGLVASDSLAAVALPADTLAVDYTTPDAALDNVRWYVENDVPFVMGTTSFDLDEAKRLVAASGVSAVIAPNMAVPIVLMQAAARWLAAEFPGALAGAELKVVESHQANKRDTSGTAKALVASANGLGVPFPVDDIEKVRDPARQQSEVGVPAEHLAGHAFHRYELSAAAGTVQLVLEHNVLGRRVYAEGTLAALRFLQQRLAAGSRGEVLTMEDVLRG
ncbi:dihydrodipicolinate reductase C-terminal domain-containing protein [Botrimarina mediterranea]|uniref:4-hydroxy-tetrahydrodipicolinate reductase n=1 Tax=Botrimarina mediterranea TaxID=2528022 RepID=A0A518K4V9_9BACT|nr:dihydrodipicolinate reductase C-terminal domain-containing protein [Botrimarina mediterranea]QDV72826.1 4-hydroxy-tetrahydrodipicolinate reductase [Botrimarina mediterranea]